jgi:transcriptional regulator with XRE-family HTH domain
MLITLLTDRIHALNLSARESARLIGISHTTLNRVLDGATYDLPTLRAISEWLTVPMSTLLELESSSPTMAAMTALVESSPELARAFRDAVAMVARGMPAHVYRDIVRYAIWRMTVKY